MPAVSVTAWREGVAAGTAPTAPASARPVQQRPATAQHPRGAAVAPSGIGPGPGGGRPGQLRPLGPAQPAALGSVRHGAAAQSGAAGGGRGYIAALKSEILSVQRSVDAVRRGKDEVMIITPEMRALEQRLLCIQYDSDPLNMAKAQVALLEILMHGVGELAALSLARAKESPALRSICPRPSRDEKSIGTLPSSGPVRPSTAPASRTQLAGGAAALAEPRGAADTVISLVTLLGNVCDRQEAWKAAADDSVSVVSAEQHQQPQQQQEQHNVVDATPTPQMTTHTPVLSASRSPRAPPMSAKTAALDAALQQPAVAQLTALIAQQQKLQGVLSVHLRKTGAISGDSCTVATQTLAPPRASSGDLSRSIEGREAKQKSAPTSKPAAKSGRGAAAATTKSAEPADVAKQAARLAELESRIEKACFAGPVAFSDLDRELLAAVGVESHAYAAPPTVMLPDESKAEGAARAQELVSAVRFACEKALAVNTDSFAAEVMTPTGKGTAKGRKDKPTDDEALSASAQREVDFAQALLTLKQQNELLGQLQAAARRLLQARKQGEEKSTREVARYRTNVETLTDRLRDREREWEREQLAVQTQMKDLRDEVAELRRKNRALTETATPGPHVSCEGDPPTAAEQRAAMVRQLRATEGEVARALEHAQGLQKELQQALSERDEAQREAEQLRTRAEEAEQALAAAAARAEQFARELECKVAEAEVLGDKAASAAARREDDEDKIRKLSIELNILKGTVRLLREQEDAAAKEAADAAWRSNYMRQQVESAERERASSQAKAELEQERLREEVRAYRAAAHDEREQRRVLEAEIARLRETERRLDQLQRDFSNYTLSKLRQGEEAEEDERVMQEVLEMLGVDLFRLPDPDASRDELELAISQLREKRARLDAEQRQQERDPKQRSAKSQIVHILQRRMNSIQLFAFTEKRAALARAEEIRLLQEAAHEARNAHADETKESNSLRVRAEADADAMTRLREEKTALQEQLEQQQQQQRGVEQRLHAQASVVRKQELELADLGTQLNEARRRLDRAARGGPATPGATRAERGAEPGGGAPSAGALPRDGAQDPHPENTGQQHAEGDSAGEDLDVEDLHPALRP
eukprot:TRINITY_DN6532_c0_g2_i2.p1 TRINITY_DN6532_c0_g2~~TRINITY_DN6532_c0_g2_i2.p1  ORF type:complete len:1108 (+),score=388.75 TRINITY_DN6532_c0_g2_i2:74-3397(+)